MVAIRGKTVSKIFSGHDKWAAWLLIVGVVTYVLISHRGLFGGAVRGGATSGKLAKLDFRLHEGGNFAVTSIAWSPDGKYIATGSSFVPEIHIWDVGNRRITEKLTIPFPPGLFNQLAWSPNGQFLAACDGRGVLRIYKSDTWATAHVFSELHQMGGCNHPIFSSDSSHVAVLGNRLVVYSVPDWRLLQTINLAIGWAKGDLLHAISYLPHTDTVLVAGGTNVGKMSEGELEPMDGRVWLVSAKSEVPYRSISVYPPAGGHAGGGPVWNLAVSPDGRTMVVGTNSGTMKPGDTPIEPVHIVRLSDGATVGDPLDTLPPFAAADGLVFTTDNRYIVVGHDQADGPIHIISAHTYALLDTATAGNFIYGIAVNGKDDAFAAGVGDQIIIWSLPDR